MRAVYATLAATLMTLIFTGMLTAAHVFVIATLMGLVRSSDLAVRSSLVGETMPPRLLLRAMGIARTTTDTARILGALTGAALVAALGMGPAYVMIVLLYLSSLMLTLQTGRGGRTRRAAVARAASAASAPHSPWADLREGFGHVWATPHLLAAMCLAFLVNLTAFPLMNNLMPYVAKEVYHTDQTGLGYLVAGCAFGALVGSLVISRIGAGLQLARMIVVFSLVWHALLWVFSQMPDAVWGFFVLVLAGFAQSLTMVSMATMLIRNAEPRYRGRVMGIRMFAIYALPIGLLAAGPLITYIGYQAMAALYCFFGMVVTLLIALRWRAHLWHAGAPANAVGGRH
jgi:predicted MFS family arabinose efflux permease